MVYYVFGLSSQAWRVPEHRLALEPAISTIKAPLGVSSRSDTWGRAWVSEHWWEGSGITLVIISNRWEWLASVWKIRTDYGIHNGDRHPVGTELMAAVNKRAERDVSVQRPAVQEQCTLSHVWGLENIHLRDEKQVGLWAIMEIRSVNRIFLLLWNSLVLRRHWKWSCLRRCVMTAGVAGWWGNTEGFLRSLTSGVKVGPWTRRCRCGSAASRLPCRAAPAPAPGREACRWSPLPQDARPHSGTAWCAPCSAAQGQQNSFSVSSSQRWKKTNKLHFNDTTVSTTVKPSTTHTRL